jgi:TatD DNase family protein
LSQQYDFVYAAVGVHPHNAAEIDEGLLETLKEYAKMPKTVAIGEIGLDYYYDNSPREIQKYWFARQIGLAKNLNLPIIVHDRDAHEDVMNILKAEGAKAVGGVMHCFSGSVEMARDLLELNFYISIGGLVTFKNAKKTVEVVKEISIQNILIETDCPYLAPVPFRGKRNDSSYLKYIVEKIAEIKGIDVQTVSDITCQSATKLFRI